MNFKGCSAAAHLMHSRLQMVWKRLVVPSPASANDLIRKNNELFEKIAASVIESHGLDVTGTDLLQASELLLYSLHANRPVYYYEILSRQVINKWVEIVSVTSHEGCHTISPADAHIKFTEEEAKEMLRLILDYNPKSDIWLRSGVAKNWAR